MPIRLWRAVAGPASRLSVRSEMKVAGYRTKRGYRTLRVAGGVTFRLIHAGKSVF